LALWLPMPSVTHEPFTLRVQSAVPSLSVVVEMMCHIGDGGALGGGRGNGTIGGARGLVSGMQIHENSAVHVPVLVLGAICRPPKKLYVQPGARVVEAQVMTSTVLSGRSRMPAALWHNPTSVMSAVAHGWPLVVSW